MSDNIAKKLFGGKDELAKQFEFESKSFATYSYHAITSMLNRFESNLVNMGIIKDSYPVIADLYDVVKMPDKDRISEVCKTRIQFTFGILITDPHTLLAASLAFSKDGLSREIIIGATCNNCSRVLTECVYQVLDGEESLRSDISKSICRYCSKIIGN